MKSTRTYKMNLKTLTFHEFPRNKIATKQIS